MSWVHQTNTILVLWNGHRFRTRDRHTDRGHLMDLCIRVFYHICIGREMVMEWT